MPERQQLRATLVLPEGLTEDQIKRLRKVFKTELIAIVGGVDFLRDKNITVLIQPQIERPVILG
jgi:hypothetical protein